METLLTLCEFGVDLLAVLGLIALVWGSVLLSEGKRRPGWRLVAAAFGLAVWCGVAWLVTAMMKGTI